LHLLLVALRFPPQSGGGVLRPHKFAKYLTRAGVRVTVLTVGPVTGELPSDLPREVRLLQIPERGPMARLRRLDKVRPGAPHYQRYRFQLLARLGLFHWLAPDEHAGWIAPAVDAGSKVPDVDVVLATGGPWSDFLVGDGVARRLGVPLVLAYRDPWTTGPKGWPYAPGLRARPLARGQERRVAGRADRIVSAHLGLPALLEDQLGIPGLSERCHWIPNGYDPEDFVNVQPKTSDCFTLTWTGSLYAGRSLEPIFVALSELGRAGRIDLARVKLQVYGVKPEQVRAQCTDPTLRANLDAPGEVPHDDALAAIFGSTVNLLVDISYSGPVIHTPGKLYEYLAAGRPVLSLSPEGVQADLIREAQGGWVVPPGDDAALREALADAYARWAAGRELPRPIPSVIETYDRKRSTEKLRGVLEELVHQRQRKSGAA